MLSAKQLFLILIGAAVVLEVIADVLFKKWALGSRPWFLAIGLTLYLVGTVFWAYSLRHEELAKAITVFTVLNLILVVLAGVLLFKEELSLTNKIGIGLGIVSVILIEL